MENNINLSNEIKKYIERYPKLWTKQQYKQETILYQKGDIIQKNHYIKAGILVATIYNEEILDEKGMEKNIINDFFSKGDLIFSTENIFQNFHILVDIKIIEDAEIYSIDVEEWNKLKEKEKILYKFENQYFTNIMKSFLNKDLIFSYQNTDTCYKKLLEIYPYSNRIKDEDLANYLRVSRTTINRIRNNYKKT